MAFDAQRVGRPAVFFCCLVVLAVVAFAIRYILEREHLRMATVEAALLCEQIAREGECPEVLALPGRSNAATDPWDRPYRCRAGADGYVEVTSAGANGLPGYDAVVCYPADTGGEVMCRCRVR